MQGDFVNLATGSKKEWGLIEMSKNQGKGFLKSAGWVYLIKAKQYYKIGCSINPAKRYEAINKDLPWYADLVHVIRVSNMNFAESFLHKVCKPYSIRREWYQLPEVIVNWICSIEKIEAGEMPKVPESLNNLSHQKREPLREYKEIKKLKMFLKRHFPGEIKSEFTVELVKLATFLLKELKIRREEGLVTRTNKNGIDRTTRRTFINREQRKENKIAATGVVPRINDCHPEKPHHAKGKCLNCYIKEWVSKKRTVNYQPSID